MKLKKNNKKGFTIVELVIVIAVIAILAAVLIPTFTGLIKKANVSNDTAVARNLNTAAISAQADTFDQSIEAVKENGYLLANLNAKAEDCYFVWEDDSNQFLLYDLKENKVVYSNTDDYGDIDESWCIITSSQSDFNTVSSALPKATCKLAIAEYSNLNELLAAGGTQTIYIDESLVIEDGSAIAVNTESSDITLNLGSSSISTNGTISGAPIYVKNGTLTVQGGTLNASGEFTNEHGTFNCAIGYDGPGKLNVDGTNFIGITGINGALKDDGHVELVIKNSTFDVTSGGVILSTGGYESTATIENCTIDAGKYAIFTSQAGTITVNGGSYKGGTEVLHSQDANSKIIVNDGTFDGAISVTNGATLVINKGTFRNTGLTLEVFKSYVSEGKTVTENADGSWTVN